MVLCQRCYLRSRIMINHVSMGTSQIAGTLSATIVIPFHCPCTKVFSHSEREKPEIQQQLLWELWETNCCAFVYGNSSGIHEALVTDKALGFSIVSTGSYAMCSVMIPQTKHANSLAAAVFATFLGEWDAIR